MNMRVAVDCLDLFHTSPTPVHKRNIRTAQPVWDDARNGYSRCQDENIAMDVCLIAWRGRPRRAISRAAHMHVGLVWMEPWSCCLRKMTVWMLPVELSWFACSGYITDTLFGLKYLPGNLIFVNCEGI